jgi:hypothetical protein
MDTEKQRVYMRRRQRMVEIEKNRMGWNNKSAID